MKVSCLKIITGPNIVTWEQMYLVVILPCRMLCAYIEDSVFYRPMLVVILYAGCIIRRCGLS